MLSSTFPSEVLCGFVHCPSWIEGSVAQLYYSPPHPFMAVVWTGLEHQPPRLLPGFGVCKRLTGMSGMGIRRFG